METILTNKIVWKWVLFWKKKKSHFSTTQTTHFSTYTVLVNFSPHTFCTILQPTNQWPPQTKVYYMKNFITERERERFSTATCPLLPPTTCNPDWSLSFLFFLFFYFYCFDFIWFMRKIVFVFGCVLRFVAIEIKKRERVRKKEKWKKDEKTHFLFNRVIIWWENNIWSCYSNCYSALFFKRATVTTLKKKFRIREAIGRFFLCLISKIGFREPIGDALRAYQKSVIYALKINFRRLWSEV